jgi:hypothetical protein
MPRVTPRSVGSVNRLRRTAPLILVTLLGAVPAQGAYILLSGDANIANPIDGSNGVPVNPENPIRPTRPSPEPSSSGAAARQPRGRRSP